MQKSSDYFKKELKKRIYDLVIDVLKTVEPIGKKDITCYRVSDQLVRSITSIIANYVEG